jgi:hypothetical protein
MATVLDHARPTLAKPEAEARQNKRPESGSAVGLA